MLCTWSTAFFRSAAKMGFGLPAGAVDLSFCWCWCWWLVHRQHKVVAWNPTDACTYVDI